MTTKFTIPAWLKSIFVSTDREETKNLLPGDSPTTGAKKKERVWLGIKLKF
jgi:hypothetical protein